MPADRSGVASALLNASREVAGLLGITVIGAVLRTRRAAALRGRRGRRARVRGRLPRRAVVTIVLLAAGVAVSYLTLRPARPPPRPRTDRERRGHRTRHRRRTGGGAHGHGMTGAPRGLARA